MFFWRKKPPTRGKLWLEFAKRLELIASDESRQDLSDLLNLSPEAGFKALFVRRLGEGRRLFFFELEDTRRGPAGSVSQLTSGCLFQSPQPVAAVSLRASARLHPVLESLGASASGGQRLVVPGADAFNERVTIYARDPAQALRLLTPAVCTTLERSLCERQASPTLLAGEHHLVLINRTRPEAPTPFEVLEELSSDLLSLQAAFAAGLRTED